MKNIWLIRHGESLSNSGEKTKHPGTSSLTKKGALQSDCIASFIKERPKLIIHSPYIRALQSAKPTINKFPGVIIEEWSVQEFIYLPHKKYLDSTQADRKGSVIQYWDQCDPELKMSDESESFVEFIERMEMIIEKLSQRKDLVIIFTHGHVLRAMIWKIITGKLKKTSEGMAQYRSLRHAIYIPNGAILKIKLDKHEAQLSQLITSHLQQNEITRT